MKRIVKCGESEETECAARVLKIPKVLGATDSVGVLQNFVRLRLRNSVNRE